MKKIAAPARPASRTERITVGITHLGNTVVCRQLQLALSCLSSFVKYLHDKASQFFLLAKLLAS